MNISSLSLHLKKLNVYLNVQNNLESIFCCFLKKYTSMVLSFQPNYQIGTEIEVISSKVSEGRMYENQSHVALPENLHVNKVDVLDKKMR